ncbi:hypothetical protein L486_00018 [Kwoniella mangroviensis CBS 10435]|uniref:Uncharacterized protein n=1 Tax=Kwoniella mangroviensis CBS 10435 TaxID=1331196 RepID=A0A1B9IXY4_9TREE|nr:hypothetical protein L486_00018 [Kwoniella mangroviensis CBS 10435]
MNENEDGTSIAYSGNCTKSDSASALRELEQRWQCAEKDLAYCKIQKWDKEFQRALKDCVQSTNIAKASLRGSISTAHVNEDDMEDIAHRQAVHDDDDSLVNGGEGGDKLFDDEFRSLLDVDLRRFIESDTAIGQDEQKDLRRHISTYNHPSVRVSSQANETYLSLEKAESSYRRLESFLGQKEQNLFDPDNRTRYNKALDQDVDLWDEWISLRKDVSMIRECHKDISSS